MIASAYLRKCVSDWQLGQGSICNKCWFKSSLVGWYVRCEVASRIVAIFLGVASRKCSKQHAAFWFNSHLHCFSMRFVSVNVVPSYSSSVITTVCKKSHFILSVLSDFYMIDNLSKHSVSFLRFQYMASALNIPRRLICH